jgi:hypothetical protein
MRLAGLQAKEEIKELAQRIERWAQDPWAEREPRSRV